MHLLSAITKKYQLQTEGNYGLFILVSVLLILLALLFSVGPRLLGNVSPQDEGILLVYPDLILRGLTPNKDFSTLYTPGNFYLIAWFFDIFGTNLIVERAIGFLYMYAIAITSFFLGLQVNRGAAIIAAFLCIIVLHFFPTAGAYSATAAIALSLLSLLACHIGSLNTTQVKHELLAFVGGFLVGLAILFRQDMGAYIGIACLMVTWVSGTKNIKYYIFGAVVGVTLLVYHAVNVGVEFAWDNYVQDVLRIGPGRHLPLHASVPLAILLASVAISLIVSVIFMLRWRKDTNYPLILGASLFSVLLLPSAVQRADNWHIAYVGAAVLPITAIVVIAFLLKIRDAIEVESSCNNKKYSLDLLSVPTVRISALAIVVLLLLTAGAYLYKQSKSWYWGISRVAEKALNINGRWVLINRNDKNDVLSIVLDLKSRANPGSRVFVGPSDLRRTNYNDSFIYFLIPEMTPASYFIEMNPGSANRVDSRLASDLHDADYLILTSKYDKWNENNDSMSFGNDIPNKIIESSFCLATQHGPYSLYSKCR